MKAGAELSACGSYRYALWRSWDPTLSTLLFVGLNPSTADAHQDDPTLRRCIGFARRWGFGTVVLGNLFGWRSTDPKVLRQVEDPVGPHNDEWLVRLAGEAALVVGCWGAGGSLHGRDQQVQVFLDDINALGCTAAGQPRHPLYVRADRELEPWRGLAAA